MKIVYWTDKKILPYLIKMLQFENVILGDTDTVLGLFSPVSQKGFNKLNIIKKREDKPYLILIASKIQLNYFVDIKNLLPSVKKLIDNCWPGPVTLIFNAKQTILNFIKSKQGTIALRVPDHAGLQQLLPHFTGLFSTSANISSEPIPQKIAEVNGQIIKQVPCAVLNKKEKLNKSVPSTIIDCSGEKIVVVRAGAYSINEVR
ncbi:MAG: L-threonylcarbamoyladenylate synthase [Candidatus Babeliales bacterium]